MSQTFEEKVEALASELGEQIARLAKNDKEMTDGLAIAAIALIDSAVELDDVFEELDDDELDEDYLDDEWDDDWFGLDDDDEEMPRDEDDFFGRPLVEDILEDEDEYRRVPGNEIQ